MRRLLVILALVLVGCTGTPAPAAQNIVAPIGGGSGGGGSW